MNKKRKAGDGNANIIEDSGWRFDGTAIVKDKKLLQ